MTYGASFNLFFKEHAEKTNQEKIEILKQYDVGDTLTLLRNIEESPREFDAEIIQEVYRCLFNKGIICM
jgi:hypothetical protein